MKCVMMVDDVLHVFMYKYCYNNEGCSPSKIGKPSDDGL